MASVNDLVDALLNKDHIEIRSNLDSIMADKVSAALEFKREQMGQTIFGGPDDQDEEEEFDDEDYE